MILGPVAVSRSVLIVLILSGASALSLACEPNVVIGAKWRVEEEPGGDSGSGGSPSPGGSSSAAGTAAGGAASGAGGTESTLGGAAATGDGGASSAGAGGAAPVEEWCATAPWMSKTAVAFGNDEGSSDIPVGSYVIRYVSGGQVHDLDLGYEVTGHYYFNSLEAGHHVFGGDSPETGTPSLWLEDVGLLQFGADATLAQVEEANRGHAWPPFEHPGGQLHITLYDDDFRDNKGPGSRFCISAAPP
jgi:hypothetical protein